MLTLSVLTIGLLTRFAPLSTPLTRCGAPSMIYDRGQDTGAEVDEATPQPREGASEPRRRSGRSNAAAFGNRIFVENLNLDTSWGALKDHFTSAGYPVAYASVSYDREAQRSKGQGIVQFETGDAMAHALSDAGMTGTTLDGVRIKCRPDAKALHVAARARDSRRQYDGYSEQGGQSRGGGDRGRSARGLGGTPREYNEFGHDYTRHADDRTTLDSAATEKVRMHAHAHACVCVCVLQVQCRCTACTLLLHIAYHRRCTGYMHVCSTAGAPAICICVLPATYICTLLQVHQLLRQRLECKLSRDFSKADKLLEALGGLGVSVADRQRQWRADGISFERAYTRVAKDVRSGPGGQVDTSRVGRLLEERASARRRKDFGAADELRDELRLRLGVEVDDQERTWWLVPEDEAEPGGAGSEPGGAGSDLDSERRGRQNQGGAAASFATRVQALPYSRSPNCDVDLSSQEREQIEDLLDARQAAKRRRNFQRADDLQLELRALGVETDDTAREWRLV